MEIIQIITLAIIQGLTEFLPISSSGHLVLAPLLTGWPDQGLAFDVATHVGTLTAVLAYFYRDLISMSHSGIASLFGSKLDQDGKMLYMLILATIPVGLAGLLFSGFIENNLRTILIIGLASIGFGLLLYLADIRGSKHKDTSSINFKDALYIGLAQVFALIPGTSRSSITMTVGLMLGFSRQASARFSFLLSIPVILLAGLHEGYKLATAEVAVDWLQILLAAVISAIVAFLTIHFFLKLIDKVGMLPFVIYRVLLGLGLLLFLFFYL